MHKPDRQTVFLGSVILGSVVLLGYLLVFHQNGQAGDRPPGTQSRHRLEDIPFDGQRAYQMLKTLCALGPRPSGSPGMKKQQELLVDHFTTLGATVDLEEFQVRHPLDGSAVKLANLLVQWHPDRRERILLAAHYDTRPFPDRDPNPARRRGTFVGANDGASGVAVLAELAYHMPSLESRFGVDFVLFDGEEFVFNERTDRYFLGSEYFSRRYVAAPGPYRYRWGVLLDMVGDAELHLYQEKNSV